MTGYQCAYTGCSDPDKVTTMVRAKSTEIEAGKRKLIEYRTMTDATGYSRVRNASNDGSASGWALDPAYTDTDWGVYDCTVRPWYTNAVAAPLIEGTCWGQPIFTDVYLWGGLPLMSMGQAFYKC